MDKRLDSVITIQGEIFRDLNGNITVSEYEGNLILLEEDSVHVNICDGHVTILSEFIFDNISHGDVIVKMVYFDNLEDVVNPFKIRDAINNKATEDDYYEDNSCEYILKEQLYRYSIYDLENFDKDTLFKIINSKIFRYKYEEPTYLYCEISNYI